ncbi:hypothetical protein HDU76_003912 [Blyttiomyces sp. JEL0837]|nr:hypothetical protein HDU76_003912 [Blyttiomyces sp. JEL0837]
MKQGGAGGEGMVGLEAWVVADVPGFTISTDEVDDISDDGDGTILSMRVTVMRSFTTKLFSIFVMVIMWALSFLTLGLSISPWLLQKAVEPPAIVFGLALVFALPAVRNSQPGVPPIGCTSDVVSFFWTMMLTSAGAALMLSNYRPRSDHRFQHQFFELEENNVLFSHHLQTSLMDYQIPPPGNGESWFPSLQDFTLSNNMTLWGLLPSDSGEQSEFSNDGDGGDVGVVMEGVENGDLMTGVAIFDETICTRGGENVNGNHALAENVVDMVVCDSECDDSADGITEDGDKGMLESQRTESQSRVASPELVLSKDVPVVANPEGGGDVNVVDILDVWNPETEIVHAVSRQALQQQTSSRLVDVDNQSTRMDINLPSQHGNSSTLNIPTPPTDPNPVTSNHFNINSHFGDDDEDEGDHTTEPNFYIDINASNNGDSDIEDDNDAAFFPSNVSEVSDDVGSQIDVESVHSSFSANRDPVYPSSEASSTVSNQSKASSVLSLFDGHIIHKRKQKAYEDNGNQFRRVTRSMTKVGCGNSDSMRKVEGLIKEVAKLRREVLDQTMLIRELEKRVLDVEECIPRSRKV